MRLPERRSTSQRRTYRRCGYLYLMQYGQGWRPRQDKGKWIFGHVMERVAEDVALRKLTSPKQAEEFFLTLWDQYEQVPLSWPKSASWKMLRERGMPLARLVAEEVPSRVHGEGAVCQEEIHYDLDGVPELAIPDYYGTLHIDPTWDRPRPGVLDWKTADRQYMPLQVELDEQLTNYQLAEGTKGRPVEVVAFCVMIYTTMPRIQWLWSEARAVDELARFRHAASTVDRLIRQEVFPRNDRACFSMGECPMVPLCYDSQRGRVETELERTKEVDDDALGWDET